LLTKPIEHYRRGAQFTSATFTHCLKEKMPLGRHRRRYLAPLPEFRIASNRFAKNASK